MFSPIDPTDQNDATLMLGKAKARRQALILNVRGVSSTVSVNLAEKRPCVSKRIRARKIGFVFKPEGMGPLWASHAMAPAPIRCDAQTIRLFVGGWTEEKIARIFSIDVSAQDPTRVLAVCPTPVLDIGRDGCFDENGVFPAHAYDLGEGRIYLYYTGFQLGHKIRHYNFGGLAVSDNYGQSFQRISEAPLLDRADEGLFVRAGQSIERAEDGGFHVVYSAGSAWHLCAGEMRPVYDVYYQKSEDGLSLSKQGRKIISCDLSVEHGLGRPQIIRLGGRLRVFYTRRIIDGMKYFLGMASSDDGVTWQRDDEVFESVPFGASGSFDAEMVYFPAAIQVDETTAYVFYSGNSFGRDGMGVIALEWS